MQTQLRANFTFAVFPEFFQEHKKICRYRGETKNTNTNTK